MKVVALLLFALPAFAQTPETEPPAREVNFEKPDVVEGAGVSPDLDPVLARQRERARSLIRIRTDFQAEMLRSVEDI